MNLLRKKMMNSESEGRFAEIIIPFGEITLIKSEIIKSSTVLTEPIDTWFIA